MHGSRVALALAHWRVFLPWLAFASLAWLVVAVLGVDVPREDDWFLPPLLADGGLTLYNVFAPANEHRIALSRLISLGLAWAAGWNLKLYMFVNVAAATAACFVVARIAWRQVPAAGRDLVFHFANLVSCALMLSAAQHEAWLFGALMPFFLVNLLVVTGILLLGDARPASAPGRRLLAALCCTLASFSAAHGLFAWPALAPLLADAQRRRTLVRLGIWLALGALVVFLYLSGVRATPTETVTHTVVTVAGRLPVALLTLLGAPWSSHPLAAPVAGAVLLAALLWSLFARGRVRWADTAPWLALAAFAMLGALAIAGGRVLMNETVGLTGRYLPLTALFSVAVVQILRVRLRPSTAAVLPFVHATAGALLCALVVRSLGALDEAALQARRLRHLQSCLAIVHQAPRSCLGHAHPDLTVLPHNVAQVQARGLRFFERTLPLVDDPGERAGYIDLPAAAAGPVRLFRGRKEFTTVRLSGWAAIPGRRQPAEIVLFTYNGERRFFASTPVDRPRTDVARALGQRSARNAGWEIGLPAVALPPGAGVIKAWTWDRKGRRFLRLAGEVSVEVIE